MRLSQRQVQAFHQYVYRFAQTNTRRFPWRTRRTPYRVLVSEVMLQQTQADRVSPFFIRFLKRFPSVRSLARAQTQSVVSIWKGLGYNRRALNLKRAAEKIVLEHGGVIPKSVDELKKLPGIGAYTAGAILAFAFNKPVSFIETNIRSVYLNRFLKHKGRVRDEEILALVEQTLDRKKPRVWYEALMDLGTHLKKIGQGYNVRSVSYVRQKPFKGSRRELRGKLLSLALRSPITKKDLNRFCREHAVTVQTSISILRALVSEGFFSERRIRDLLERI